MDIQPEPAHHTPLIEVERERGGTHDKDGYVLSAHRDKSQGRPRTTSSSQLISQIGLPVRVSQRPHIPGATKTPGRPGQQFHPPTTPSATRTVTRSATRSLNSTPTTS